MKTKRTALKYSGLPPNSHTVIYDARDADMAAIRAGHPNAYTGSPITIHPGDLVPMEAFHKAEFSGDVAAIHVQMGLAEVVEVAEIMGEDGPTGQLVEAPPDKDPVPEVPDPRPRPTLPKLTEAAE